VIIQRGSRPDSSTYVKMKLKAAEAGMKCTLVALDANSTTEDVIRKVQECNSDDKVHGVLVQLPLGEGVNGDGERRVVEAVSPEKDVDG
jgi:methylenetetrahydrofolate dehydrogenase (NADP+)/methenyltetrahydrofolate cyclohydrolase/formyltetrahydrofolate synthetase